MNMSPLADSPYEAAPLTFEQVIDDLVGVPDSEAAQAQDGPQSDREDQPVVSTPRIASLTPLPTAGEGLGEGVTERSEDLSSNSFDVSEHVNIVETDDAISGLSDECGPTFVFSNLRGVAASVNFDCKSVSGTVEVDYVRANRLLSAEPEPGQFSISED